MTMDSWIFPASIVRCYVEDDVAVIGISDDGMRPDNFLILTRMLEPESGDDGVGLQTSRSDREWRDAVASVRLAPRMLSLRIREESAAAVGGLEIRADLSQADFSHAALAEALRQMFDASDTVLEFKR